jgi:hypothetical protein
MGRSSEQRNKGYTMSNQDPLDPKSVHDEASFLAFVSALAEDRRLASQEDAGPHDTPRGWYNHSIEDFLEASLSWAEDSELGRRQGLPEKSSPPIVGTGLDEERWCNRDAC